MNIETISPTSIQRVPVVQANHSELGDFTLSLAVDGSALVLDLERVSVKVGMEDILVEALESLKKSIPLGEYCICVAEDNDCCFWTEDKCKLTGEEMGGTRIKRCGIRVTDGNNN